METKTWTASEMGKKGGKNRAKKLSKKERVEIARQGGIKRWELDNKHNSVSE